MPNRSDLDLWPEKFGAVQGLTPPVTLLKEQSARLAEKTGRVVLGEVETKVHQAPVRSLDAFGEEESTTSNALLATPSSPPTPLEVLNGARRFIHYLYLEAPELGNYRHALLSVTHSLIPYPLTVHVDGADGQFECVSEEEFLGALRQVFHSERTARIIETLIAQSSA